MRIRYGVQSDYKNIYKEKLVYDYKDLLAGMGGTLSLFIGFAIFNIYEDLIDKTMKGIKRFQRRLFKVKDSKKLRDESISTSSTTDILPVEPYTLVSVFTPEGTEEKCVFNWTWARIEEKDRQTQLLCYVSLIRACNKVL